MCIDFVEWEKKMNEKLLMKVILIFNNTIRIICFTYLAMLFERWWIVLLTLLFLVSE